MQPRKLRGKRIDYKYLNDPFPDEEEAAELALAAGEIPEPVRPATYASEQEDECRSLQDAKNSYEWPEWQDAINVELEQLQAMGTWRLVDTPKNAVPIANKWVFTKK
jgi:hypothetical protein